MQVKKQRLELGMEQLTGSKLEEEYVRANRHLDLIYMQSTFCKMSRWVNCKLEAIWNINSLRCPDDTTVKAKSEEVKVLVTQLCPTLGDLLIVARQAPLSVEFSRQEYWSQLPCPPAVALPNPGIEPASLMSSALAGRFFTNKATWEALSLSFARLNFQIMSC